MKRATLIARWENALRVLKKMTPHERKKHFDMGTFGDQTPCGTVACLAGHCSLDPWFRRKGFSSHWSDGNLFFDKAEPEEFFDDREAPFSDPARHGSDIFYRTAASWAEVVKQVQAHITHLKS